MGKHEERARSSPACSMEGLATAQGDVLLGGYRPSAWGVGVWLRSFGHGDQQMVLLAS